MRGWIQVYHANSSGKKERLAILIWGKINFEIETIKKDKLGHYIMMKGSIQEDITLVNIYTPNLGASEYIKQILTDIKGEIDGYTIIVEYYISHWREWTDLDKKINKATEILNDTMEQSDLIDIFRTSHAKQKNRIHIPFKWTWNIL